MTPPPPSFDQLLAQLRQRDEAAAAAVFHRFRHRLIGLARQQLDGPLQRKLGPEDVVQSVFRTVFRRLAEGQFDLGDWDSLWSLLTCITVRKCGRWREYFRAQARDVLRECPPPVAAEGDSSGLEVLDREPAPEEVAMLREAVQQLLSGLTDAEQQIAMLILEGHAPAEVGRAAGCSESKAYRVRRLVLSRLERMREADHLEPKQK
jgi:RNA polymerase sigma-70 factor (ECF subfamily)